MLSLRSPWENNSNPIWIASSLNLVRNVENFLYPAKLSTRKRTQIFGAITEELDKEPKLQKALLLKAEEISPTEKEFLYEHFLTPYTFHQAQKGEGFMVSPGGKLLISINLKDHIQFRIIDCQTEIEEEWNQLADLDIFLGKKLGYAFNPKYGFLTADPTQCGTALTATAFLQVPALIHTGKIDEFLSTHRDNSLMITGLQGKLTESLEENIGDILTIYNNYTLGTNEENILSSVRSFATKLLVMEKSIRKSIIEGNDHPDLKDRVSRAYAVLIHSYQIDTVEAMNSISLMKLGLDLGWLDGVNMSQLNALFFNCRRAHLAKYFDQEISTKELTHKRAEFIHKILKSASLKI
ncbi:MAG: protein arginine kinase [Chlamydiales bacterium]